MLHVLLCIFEKTSSKGIERVQQDDKGVIWIKLINSFFGTENDIYATSYIPPIDSPVYKNAFSLLYEFDFYERLTADIQRYTSLDDILLTGDFNARVSQLSDVIENIDLEGFIDITTYNVPVDTLPTRVSFDYTCNQFGNTLLNLCKESSSFNVNVRLETGMYTCCKFHRTRLAASVVCYC